MTPDLAIRLYYFSIPAGLTVLAFLVWPFTPQMGHSVVYFYNVLVLALLATGYSVCKRYSDNRIFPLLTLIAASHITLTLTDQIPGVLPDNVKHIYALGCLLLVIGFMRLPAVSQRGLLSPESVMRNGAILALFTLVAVTDWQIHSGWLSLVHFQFIVKPLPDHVYVPQAAWVLFSAALAFSLLKVVLIYSNRAVSHAVALAMCFFAVVQSDPLNTALFLNGAMLVLIASVLQNAWLYAVQDELTGLAAAPRYQSKLRLLKSDFIIAKINIDHFEVYNLGYGQETGEQVLRYVTSQMRQVTPDAELFRSGPSQFALVFQNTNLISVQEQLEQLRARISSRLFTTRAVDRRKSSLMQVLLERQRSRRVSVTISVGVAQQGVRFPNSLAVNRAADYAMHKAIKRGNNRILIQHEPIETQGAAQPVAL